MLIVIFLQIHDLQKYCVRIDLPREITERTLKEINNLESDGGDKNRMIQASGLRQSLLRHDQLLRTISEGQAFQHFCEAEITFPPTFKFDKRTKDYDTSYKNRIPAYTDRVLFKPHNVHVIEYNSAQGAIHSDHRPVYASLVLPLIGRQCDETTKESRRKRGPSFKGDYDSIGNNRKKTRTKTKKKKKVKSYKTIPPEPTFVTTKKSKKRKHRKSK